MFSTPILFLIFNRPDCTQKVFESIRNIKPSRLYVAADGAREGNEEDVRNCRLVLEQVLENVDWDCEVKTLLRDTNLGCGRAVSEAINWFFDDVEMGIILEDDCLPSSSFFNYCETLLQKYDGDERIMMISGTNQLVNWDVEYDYFFSQIGAIWGWATWKRCWDQYDFDLQDLEQAIKEDVFNKVLINKNEASIRIKRLRDIKNSNIDTWDYQWSFARLRNNGLSIMPSKNLITNLGFGDDATHTQDTENVFSNLKRFSLNGELRHPRFIIPDAEFDQFISNMLYREFEEKKQRKSIVFELKKFLKRNFDTIILRS